MKALATILLILLLAACETPFQPPDDPMQAAMDYAVEHTHYPPAELPQIYHTADLEAAYEKLYGVKMPAGGKPLAIYDRASGSIIISKEWRVDAKGMGVLVHEMTHHLQAMDNKPVCRETWEEDAYRVQARYLTEFTGEYHGYDWIWARMPLGCE